MSSIQETVVDLLVNAMVQIGFFAIVAALFSRLTAKLKGRHQFFFYLAVLLFCLAVPVINTLGRFPANVAAEKSQTQVLSDGGAVTPSFWIWRGHAAQSREFSISPEIRSWIVGAWGVFILFRLVRFSLAVYRVGQMRRNASVVSFARVGLEAAPGVALLESTEIDDPLTVGVFRPAILVPSKLLPELGEQDLDAILAHEYGHIRRKDFLVHIVCELISLPVAWHPGIGYLMSKISEARELACDDYAAARLGERRSYATTLLRLASLCLHVPRSNAVALGIFDADNLETRIMMLTKKTLSLSRSGVITLALATSSTFAVSAVLMHAISLQAMAEPANTAEKFTGTWHWMFDGKSFATMILARNRSGVTGSVTESRIMLDDAGGLFRAEPSEDTTPKRIAKATLEGAALHITVAGGFEFAVTLKDATHAEIRPVGAPSNMKPIPAEKVHR